MGGTSVRTRSTTSDTTSHTFSHKYGTRAAIHAHQARPRDATRRTRGWATSNRRSIARTSPPGQLTLCRAERHASLCPRHHARPLLAAPGEQSSWSGRSREARPSAAARPRSPLRFSVVLGAGHAALRALLRSPATAPKKSVRRIVDHAEAVMEFEAHLSRRDGHRGRWERAQHRRSPPAVVRARLHAGQGTSIYFERPRAPRGPSGGVRRTAEFRRFLRLIISKGIVK